MFFDLCSSRFSICNLDGNRSKNDQKWPYLSLSSSLKVTSSGKGAVDDDHCGTFCDEYGCHCLIDDKVPLYMIDHVLVSPLQGGRISCFCGDFAVSFPNCHEKPIFCCWQNEVIHKTLMNSKKELLHLFFFTRVKL